MDQLAEVERAPQKSLQAEQSTLNDENAAYGSVVTELKVLQNRVTDLNAPSLFGSRLASVGDATIASATAAANAVQGTFTFNFVQLATASKLMGSANAGGSLNATNDVSTLTLSTAGFSTAITAGTFTVNGKQVTVATTDMLQQVFDNLSTATGGAVTGSYDAATDKITLSSAGEIVLGSATDTSNLLQVARLNNNGTGSISSNVALGGVRLDATISAAHLGTTVTDGGSGAGQFKINGVAINFSVGDNLAEVLQRINGSSAGVLASYDTMNDRFVLTSKTTGDVGMGLEDVTGNFLAAAGLIGTGASLQRGKDLIYTVNGGGQLTSHSNTVTDSTSGLTGLSVTALKEGVTTTVTVHSDTDKIKKAITDFLDEYNKVQTLIDTDTASSTDANGKVTAGVLATESDASDVASTLRGLVNSQMAGLTGTLKRLEQLGIVSNGNDNTLKLDDPDRLDAALQDNISGVQDLFTNSANGIGVQLAKYLDRTVGDDGSLITKQSNLTKQASDIDTQIAAMEKIVQADRDEMINRFIVMETAQQQINQQMSFLQQQFGSVSLLSGASTKSG